ncbi:uncharacterized protein LOC133290149 [Gastrolobium bilobum]|uniref:uncharacterized protein LOC133290149 n=1 Tax=Gastrolobium bilobum TaxID=150636 RepID=UPI002AB1CF70|nr:uncharacterized protein LOC133290149 [Gastrolobium bilobum]
MTATRKTLQRYLNRFKDAALQVPGLQENVHVHLIVVGLDGSSRLAKSVYKDPVRTLEEFRTRSKKYLELERMEIANALSEQGKRASPRRRSLAPREKERPGNKKKDSRSRILDDRDRVGIYEKYTPLNASRSQIWREVAMTEMKKGAKNNKRKSGNRKKSKSLVHEKKKKEERNQKDYSNNDEFPEAEFDCNMINGALGGGGDIVSARRKYLKEVLSIRDHPKFKEDPSKPGPPLLCFTKEYMQGVLPGHLDGLVVIGTLVNYRVKKIFIDVGSSADIILWGAFKKMNLDKDDLKSCKTTLIAFNGENTPPKGYIDLRLTLGTKEAFKSERVRFIVADFPSESNIILGRPTIHKWDMLVSTKHQKIKMVSSKNEIITISGDKKESRKCYFETVKRNEGGHLSPPQIRLGDKAGKKEIPHHSGKLVNVVELDMRKEAIPMPESYGELEDLVLGKEPGQFTRIGKIIDPHIKEELAGFLKCNTDVFAWKSSEIPGIDPTFCCHKLAVYPGSTPVSQKKRKLGPERK